MNVGVDHDTSTFAVESIRRWWKMMGKPAYPDAKRLLITADSGGSNGARVKLWKVELQGIKVTKAEMADLELHPEAFHGEWNYTLRPRFGSSPSKENRTWIRPSTEGAEYRSWCRFPGIERDPAIAFLGEPRFLGASAISSSLDSPRCSCKEVTSRTC